MQEEYGSRSKLSPVDAEFLWRLYLSEREFQRHHENQRMVASNILAAIASGIVVAVGSNQITREVEVLLAIALTCIGLFGYLFCGKLYSLIRRHGERSYAYLRALDEIVGSVDIHGIKKGAEDKHSEEFEFMRDVRLSGIWKSFHAVIFLAGLFLTALSARKFITENVWLQQLLQ